MIVELIEPYLRSLMPSERQFIAQLQKKLILWKPQSKPQWLALLSRADELYYGGGAGGGKTDLLLGLAIECHQHSVIFRRTFPNLAGIILRAREIIEKDGRENKANHNWTFPDGRTIEFGAVQREDDKKNWQGRPHDLKGFDEITEFTESQYVFICGWNRSTDPGQRVRVVVTGNPPMDEAGSWVVRRWSAWLDDKHPHPAKPGELRWYATVGGKEQEFPDGTPVDIDGETVYPRSRTFIPALLEDNPFLTKDSHYRSVVQSMPEPIRSMLLYGDFRASAIPNPFQVIPTEWVRAAQRRWIERERPKTSITAVGIDAARGGNDFMTLVCRYDNWFDIGVKWPGSLVPDGATAATIAKAELGDARPGCINIDVIGVGSSTYDHIKTIYNNVRPVNVSEGSDYRDKSGTLKMRNLRAELFWRMRDALDPLNGENLALPNDPELLADLCSANYKITVSGVQVEEKSEIKARIGRSPDYGDAVLLALYGDNQSITEWIDTLKAKNNAKLEEIYGVGQIPEAAIIKPANADRPLAALYKQGRRR